MMPESGGEYLYIRRGFGGLVGYLYAFMNVTVIKPREEAQGWNLNMYEKGGPTGFYTGSGIALDSNGECRVVCFIRICRSKSSPYNSASVVSESRSLELPSFYSIDGSTDLT